MGQRTPASALCDADGLFLGKAALWELVQGDHALSVAVRDEVGAQLARFQALTGAAVPRWVDGHNHAHVAPAVAAAAAGVLGEALEAGWVVRIPAEAPASSLWADAGKAQGGTTAFLRRVAEAAGAARVLYAHAGAISTDAFFGLALTALAEHGDGGCAALQEAWTTLLSLPVRAKSAASGNGEAPFAAEWMAHPGMSCVDRAAGGCGAGADDFSASAGRSAEAALLRRNDLAALLAEDGWALTPPDEAAAACMARGSPRGGAAQPIRTIVLLSQLRLATGNATTALRIRRLFASCGCTMLALDVDAWTPKRLAAFVAQHEVDAVVGVHAWRAGRLLADLPPAVVTVLILGGTDIHRDARDAERARVMRQAMQRCAVVVAFNAPLAEGAAALLGPGANVETVRVTQAVPIRFVPQGQTLAPLESAFDVRRAVGIPAAATVLLLPAGWRAVKDPLWAAQAVNSWHAAEGGSVFLVLIGPALEESVAAGVEAAAAALPGVRCHAAVPHADLLAAMEQADVVINTSRSEGECNTLLEAMSVGTAVVARRNLGNESLLGAAAAEGEARGVLVATPEALVAEAKALLADHARCHTLREAALRYLRREHSVEGEAEAYADILRGMERARATSVQSNSFVNVDKL